MVQIVLLKAPSNTCDVLNNCHPDAECAYDYSRQGYHCVCHQGYTGDGYRCDMQQPTGKCKAAYVEH